MKLLYTLLTLLLAVNALAQDEVSTSVTNSLATVINVEAGSAEVQTCDTVAQHDACEQLSGNFSCFDDNVFREYHGPDFHFLKNTTNPVAQPYKFMNDQTWVGIPVFLAGMIAKTEKTAFRQNYNDPNTNIRLIKYNFHTEIDNYTQFSGIALTAGLKMAGVEGRSSWPRLFASSMASYAVMATLVNSIKYTTSEMRPDGSTRNSWPSGHTATAFVGATILHKEYGLTRSPWYSVAGYSLATATGVMRVLNNRHWVSDVLSGAGIGILSTELAYGLCDLLFKEKGLLMNDMDYFQDLGKRPSFVSVSMGVGLGNKHLVFPPLNLGRVGDDDKPLELRFRSATAVGAEGAWFFCPYVGIGGRLRVKSTPINGWTSFTDTEKEVLGRIINDPDLSAGIQSIELTIESDHITEFAADAGVYFNFPISSRFALGSKLIGGRSVMDDIEVSGEFLGHKVVREGRYFRVTDEAIDYKWTYINVKASNSAKFGSGLSLTYAHKNDFAWRIFCDYDYTVKTYAASYAPMKYLEDFSIDIYNWSKTDKWDTNNTWTTSTRKHLHQWVLGGALCVSF